MLKTQCSTATILISVLPLQQLQCCQLRIPNQGESTNRKEPEIAHEYVRFKELQGQGLAIVEAVSRMANLLDGGNE